MSGTGQKVFELLGLYFNVRLKLGLYRVYKAYQAYNFLLLGLKRDKIITLSHIIYTYIYYMHNINIYNTYIDIYIYTYIICVINMSKDIDNECI